MSYRFATTWLRRIVRFTIFYLTIYNIFLINRYHQPEPKRTFRVGPGVSG